MAKGAGGSLQKECFPINPQLIHSLLTWGPPLAIIGLLGYVLYLRYLFYKEFPSNTLINRLRAEVDEFSGELADLTERFSKFQKRQGMREARAGKERQQSLREEAQEIIAQAAAQPPQDNGYTGPMADKLHLYRRQ